MFRNSLSKSLSGFVKNRFVAYCEEGGDLIEQANATLEEEKAKIKTPQGFDNLKNTLNGGSVNSYDGFRVIVQKQVNLNTVVSHFYWIGSQATGQPIYQYRLILPFDDGKLVNIASDAEFASVEGEVKVPLLPNVMAKSNFVLTGEKNQFSAEVEIAEESSTTQIEYANGEDKTFSLAYMQSVTPTITLGGSAVYSFGSRSLTTALGGMFNNPDNLFAIQWDDKIRCLYTRKVNPNRVHVSTDLLIDAEGNSRTSISADYMLKQSKVSMGIDSNLQLRSLVETSVAPGVQLQFAAEMAHLQGQYRFGYGIVMG